ncbi:MAG: hypothetical protein OEY49_00365 [Candidatus Heimdallarchaeota archaeon]|nr:hypothetical protein [Candidatus Heimdallarchaeota archaeon]
MGDSMINRCEICEQPGTILYSILLSGNLFSLPSYCSFRHASQGEVITSLSVLLLAVILLLIFVINPIPFDLSAPKDRIMLTFIIFIILLHALSLIIGISTRSKTET